MTRALLVLVILGIAMQAAAVLEPSFAFVLGVAWLVLAGLFQIAALLRD